MLEFREGGEVRVMTGASLQWSYSVDGEDLLMPAGPEGKAPVRQTIDLRQPGVLRLWQGTRMLSEWRRVGDWHPVGDTREGILGEWLGRQEMNGHLLAPRMIFYEGGRMLYLMPFKTTRGTWRTSGDNIDIQWPNGKRTLGLYRMTESTLTIPGIVNAERLLFQRY